MAEDHRLPRPETRHGLLPKNRAKIPVKKVPFSDRLELWFSTSRRIDGLWIGGMESKDWPGFGRVESALRLIKDHDPISYSRVTRHLDRIWVRLISNAGAHYERRSNACVVDERFVLSETVDEIASTIVHETTHARLEHWGITYEDEVRRRIEAICIRRQLNFVGKLSGGEKLREGLSATLSWCFDDHDYFSNMRFQDRHVQGSIEALRYLGAPAWFVRVVTKLWEYRLANRTRSLR